MFVRRHGDYFKDSSAWLQYRRTQRARKLEKFWCVLCWDNHQKNVWCWPQVKYCSLASAFFHLRLFAANLGNKNPRRHLTTCRSGKLFQCQIISSHCEGYWKMQRQASHPWSSNEVFGGKRLIRGTVFLLRWQRVYRQSSEPILLRFFIGNLKWVGHLSS